VVCSQAATSGSAASPVFASVAKKPGAMALTVMPWGPSVLASERVRPITPALAEA